MCNIEKAFKQALKKTDLLEKPATRQGPQNTPVCCVDAFTCRLMKLEVVSEDVLPSERLKRLLRLGNFLGSCEHREDTCFSCTHWYFCVPSPAFSQYSTHPPPPLPPKMNVGACELTGPVDEWGHKYPGTSAQSPGILLEWLPHMEHVRKYDTGNYKAFIHVQFPLIYVQ